MIQAPFVKNSKNALIVLGTSVTQNEVLKNIAEKDLNIKLKHATLNGISAQQRAALNPQSFHVYDQWFHDLNFSWPTGSLQPINTAKILSWENIDLQPLDGFVQEDNKKFIPGAPMENLFVRADGLLNSRQSERISMLPTIFNGDSLALINASEEKPLEPTSWKALLQKKWLGKVLMQKDVAIGVVELLLALKSLNLLKNRNTSNLSIEDITAFLEIFKKFLKRGQFKGFWSDENELLHFISGTAPMLCSLWWSGAMKLKALGHNVRIITPSEGYRGWFGGLALSSEMPNWALHASYDYLNWWLDGPAGAHLCRQGGYFSNQKSTRYFLENYEWDFWMDGKPALNDILNNAGKRLYSKGDLREGGSFRVRMSNIAAWNSVMDEHNFLVRKWDRLF